MRENSEIPTWRSVRVAHRGTVVTAIVTLALVLPIMVAACDGNPSSSLAKADISRLAPAAPQADILSAASKP